MDLEQTWQGCDRANQLNGNDIAVGWISFCIDFGRFGPGFLFERWKEKGTRVSCFIQGRICCMANVALIGGSAILPRGILTTAFPWKLIENCNWVGLGSKLWFVSHQSDQKCKFGSCIWVCIQNGVCWSSELGTGRWFGSILYDFKMWPIDCVTSSTVKLGAHLTAASPCRDSSHSSHGPSEFCPSTWGLVPAGHGILWYYSYFSLPLDLLSLVDTFTCMNPMLLPFNMFFMSVLVCKWMCESCQWVSGSCSVRLLSSLQMMVTNRVQSAVLCFMMPASTKVS